MVLVVDTVVLGRGQEGGRGKQTASVLPQQALSQREGRSHQVTGGLDELYDSKLALSKCLKTLR